MSRQYVIWGSSLGDESLLIRRLCIVPLKCPLRRQSNLFSTTKQDLHSRQTGWKLN